MRWKGRRQSENVEDVRGSGSGMKLGGGLFMIIAALVAMYFGVDPRLVQMFVGNQQAAPNAQQGEPPPPDAQSEFIAVILGDTEDVWTG
jgi:predicted metalloprotease